MKYFFDTEFNENVHPIELISVGIIAEDGREFYGVDEKYQMAQAFVKDQKTRDDYPHLWSCNDWVKANVLPILFDDVIGDTERHIGGEQWLKDQIIAFVGLDPAPEFWAYYGDYDWFLVTRMFKTFDRMPKKWPQICYDIHQYARHFGMHRNLPPKFAPAHNALVDARWTKAAFERIKEGRANIKEPLWP